MRSLARLLSMLAIAMFCASAMAQVTTTGSISGSVADHTGAVVANAAVTVKNNETGVENTTTTSDNGTFSVAQLPRGIYTVTVQATTGFKKSEITKVHVNVGTPTTVNVVLEVGEPKETVTIVGGGEILQTQTPNIGNTII